MYGQSLVRGEELYSTSHYLHEMISTWFYILVIIFILGFTIDTIIELLNWKHTRINLPSNSSELNYFKAGFRVSFISHVLMAVITCVLLFTGSFGKLDSLILEHISNPYAQTLAYFGVIAFASFIVSLPFSVYRTFYVEEKFGFNKTTTQTFIQDKLKSMFATIIIGGGLLAFILWIYNRDQQHFWLWSWITLVVFMILASMLFTSIILPLFNRLSPLEEGELKASIEALCERLQFPLTRLYVMDGSKRSTKANAFFSGLGPRKSIVLYDTLVSNYSTEEILAVLTHEIGHYKLRHTLKTLTASIIQTGLMFYLLGIILKSDELPMALGGIERTFQLSLTGFAILYSPVSLALSILMNSLSRKHEYEADAYAKEHYSGPHLASALAKLHKDSLSNPKPHPVYVAVHYSHPTLQQRVNYLESPSK